MVAKHSLTCQQLSKMNNGPFPSELVELCYTSCLFPSRIILFFQLKVKPNIWEEMPEIFKVGIGHIYVKRRVRNEGRPSMVEIIFFDHQT
jgi:hypothetical protein